MTENFIDHDRITRILETSQPPSREEFNDLMDQAREAGGLSPEQAATLLQVDNPDWLETMDSYAHELKEKIYGRRLVLFAPLYLSNYCINNCRYCGYQHSHRFERRKLTMEEIAAETRAIEAMGHKRIALECGEDPVHNPIDYIVEAMDTIYRTTNGQGNIRRINVNIAATTVENYQRLKEAQIGTYVLFQETYHRPTYENLHTGPKADYLWHLTAHDRAIEAGIDDVGLGVLFGLYDYRYEVLGLLIHTEHLDRDLGVGPHTISVPRLQPAPGVDTRQFPHLVPNKTFMKVIAVLRLAVPYTGMILSTREEPALRDRLIRAGISQISAGSCTGVGGYSQAPALDCAEASGSQFEVSDYRTPDEIVRNLCENGYLPSYCTACYRQGRTGDRFMSLAKTGNIHHMCQPNAILTFKEYLLDYASPATAQIGEKTLQYHLQLIANPDLRESCRERLHRLEAGERDLYF